MLKSLVSGIKLYLDKRLKEQRDETDERIADAKWHETTTAQLFSETVTTTLQGGYNTGTLTYSLPITSDTLKVIFDGVEYTCYKIPLNNTTGYGGIGKAGPNFTEFPFCVLVTPSGNLIYTQTDGEHTVSAIAETVTTTQTFKNEVKKLSNVIQIISGVTTTEEVNNALQDGKLLYFYNTVTDATRPALRIITGHSTLTDRYDFTPSDTSIIAVASDGMFRVLRSTN